MLVSPGNWELKGEDKKTSSSSQQSLEQTQGMDRLQTAINRQKEDATEGVFTYHLCRHCNNHSCARGREAQNSQFTAESHALVFIWEKVCHPVEI